MQRRGVRATREAIGEDGSWVARFGSPTVVASARQRHALGLDHWVDGTFGVARLPGRTLAVAPNGRNIAVHDLDAGLGAGLIAPQVPLVGGVDRHDHASGGPVWVDAAAGNIFVVYHGERFVDENPSSYWSYLGLAVSTDGAATFLDLGPIIEPRAAESAHDRGLLDVGPGAFVVVDGWIYVYFFERGEVDTTLPLGVARCRLSDVERAASTGRAPEFTKWFGDGWEQPGLGGLATPLVEDRILWFDVVAMPNRSGVVMVSSAADVVDGAPLWWLQIRRSLDGLHWSEPIDIPDSDTRREQFYVTLVGTHARASSDGSCSLYRVRAVAERRWETATVEHLEMSFRSTS